MNSIYKEFLKKSQQMTEEVKELTFLGEPVLSAKTHVTSFEEALTVCKELEKALIHIRSITGVGRGLAAPQIGSSERCFVTFVDNEFQYFINPSINSYSQSTNWYRETCLSCGPISCDLERSDAITISFTDKEGKSREEKFDGFWARLLQHEYDHLEGTVNINKAKPGDLFIISKDPLQEKLRVEKND